MNLQFVSARKFRNQIKRGTRIIFTYCWTLFFRSLCFFSVLNFIRFSITYNYYIINRFLNHETSNQTILKSISELMMRAEDSFFYKWPSSSFCFFLMKEFTLNLIYSIHHWFLLKLIDYYSGMLSRLLYINFNNLWMLYNFSRISKFFDIHI